MKNWQDITVKQFQELELVFDKFRKGELDTVEADVARMSICYGMTEEEIDSMTHGQWVKKLTALSFIDDVKMEFQPLNFVVVNGKRYRFIYDVRDIRAHRYIEVSEFERRGVASNLHLLAASMAVPQKRNALGLWVDEEYKAANHDLYAEDMLSAPVTAIYGSVVFFCKVFTGSMINLRGFLKSEMMKTKRMTENQAENAFIHLCSLMDGFTRQL